MVWCEEVRAFRSGFLKHYIITTMQYTKKSNTGNFLTRLTIDFPAGTPMIVQKFAAASVQTDICDRAVKQAFKVGKGKKDVLKSILDIEYTEGNSRKCESAVEAYVAKMVDGTDEEDGDVEIAALNITYKVVGQYIRDEAGSQMVRATTLVDTLAANPEVKASFKPMFEMMGMEGFDEASRTQLIEFAHSKGLGIQPAK